MTRELYEMYLLMGKDISGIVGAGNGLRKNKFLAETAKNMFGCSVKIPLHTEEAAFGAALYGMLSAGYCKSMSEAWNLIRYTYI
jgi:sedoheptulokinase